MKLLLDTHVFIWWSDEPENLSDRSLEAFKSTENSLILSIVSIWEMQIKIQIGKMRLKHTLRYLIENQSNINNIEILPITVGHIYMLENLPMHHRDPFDRLLICQAIEESLLLVSKDNVFSNYPVNIYW
jgi:PIN domain nuclease of toxin-antitoxin system